MRREVLATQNYLITWMKNHVGMQGYFTGNSWNCVLADILLIMGHVYPWHVYLRLTILQ